MTDICRELELEIYRLRMLLDSLEKRLAYLEEVVEGLDRELDQIWEKVQY